jgi:dephospho-CoA kinase
VLNSSVPHPVKIGITGGIGSGKSLVCKIFCQLGVPVYDADSHAKELMTTDGILVSQIKKEFGDLAYNPDGALNRLYLAEHVFRSENRLAILNALVHPRVGVDFESWVKKHDSHRYVLKEAALLFEANTASLLDKIIVVSAPLSIRTKRILNRDPHRTVEQVQAIVEKQMPEDKKMELADYIIVNDETKLVIPQVLALHQTFVNMAVGIF